MLINRGNPMMMGCTKYRDRYNFSLESDRDSIALLLFDAHMNQKERIELDSSMKFGNIFSVLITGIKLDKYFYCYEIDGREYIDPYAKAITDCGRFADEDENERHLAAVSVTEYDWEGDKPINLDYSDCIFYKINVRGFTKSRTSKVKKKGTFAGVVNKIDYLKELGVTSLELQPAYEFDEIGRFSQLSDTYVAQIPSGVHYTVNLSSRKVNYWGYTGGFYYAPKASFSAKASKHNGVYCDYTTEFKDMVKALHRAGIEVIMEMFFNDKSTGFILQCVEYWVTEYHIDGVHVYCDESSLRALSMDPLLADTKILTVYWNGNAGTRKHMGNYNNDFQNIARRFLKGDENMLAEYTAASRRNESNSASINYISNNNGFTLMDMVSYDRKHNELNGESNRDGEDFNHSWNCGEEGPTRKRRIKELRMRQIKNALIMVLLSGGTPLILSGDEFGNSQNGNNNPYCVDSELSWVNWKETNESREILDWTKKLIELRKNNRILHMPQALLLSDRVSCGYPDISYHGTNAWYTQMQTYDRHIGVMYSCVYGKEEDYRLIYVAYNMHWETHELALPKLESGAWKVEMCSNTAGAAIDENMRTVSVPPRSIAILTGEYDVEVKKNPANKIKKHKTINSKDIM